MKTCPFCNEEIDNNYPYCPSCKDNIEIIKKEFFISNYESLHSIVYYNDFFREHLFNYKFGMNKKYISAFAYLFEEEIKKIMLKNKIDFITCVPMNKEKFRKKGFDHMHEIADFISKDISLPLYTYEKIQKKDMHKLSYMERLNMTDIFKKGKDMQNKNIIIIDDIITTGRTMKDSARVLKEAGFDKIYGLILCSRR